MEFNQFWGNIDYWNAGELAENLAVYAPHLIAGIIMEKFKQDEVNFGIGIHGKKKWVLLSYDWYDNNKQIAIRLNNQGIFELWFEYWDEDGELVETTHHLTIEELAILPEGLKALMQKSYETGEGQSASRNQIFGSS